ncbi:MAG: TetR/AcrR family transcriptional regulator [Planctomycetes bacterium]|nr:TetR/AcrR family transcriptional regulator [Planctomycetota bacterium]
MGGLRESQKADRDRRIVAAATDLFRNTGFEQTRMETIAARAGVSTGTVYNYYESKGDLLVAIVSLEVEEVLAAGARLVAKPPADVHRAVDTLLGIYLDHSLVYLDRNMWRNAMALAIRQPDTPSGRRYNELDTRLVRQVCELVERLRDAGRVRADTDSCAVGELLFNNTNMMFTEFVKSDTMTLAQLKRAIRRQNRPLLAAVAG